MSGCNVEFRVRSVLAPGGMAKNLVPAIPGNDVFSYCLNHPCDIDSQNVGISPPLISLGGHLIVDRVEARGADSDQRFVNPWSGCRNFTDTQTGGRARLIEKNSFHEF